MTLLRITAVLASLFLALGSDALRAEDPPEPVQPVNKELDKPLGEIWKHIAETYAGKLPADWDTFPGRFNGTMTTPGYLRAVTALGATSAGDRRLRVLRPSEIDQHKCRQGGGYIGIGVAVKCVLGDNGMRIFRVLDGSIAKKAGLQDKDEVRAINGTRLSGMSEVDVMKLLATVENSVTKLAVVRDGKEQEFAITRGAGQKLGIVISAAQPCQFIVENVLAGSPAATAGVAVGDVLTHVNDNDTAGGALSWIDNQLECLALGHEESMTVRRGEKSIKFDLKGAVVTVPSTAAQSERVEVGGKSYRQVRIQNLDWVKLPNWLDDLKIAGDENVLLDLRNCSGDNPEVVARVALRLLENGHVLTYSQRQGANTDVVNYVIGELAGDTVLVSTHGDKTSATVETINSRKLIGKLVVLVDETTSGTAEALTAALKANRNAAVVGRTTAGRNKLVVTTTFAVEKEELVVQVPARTVLATGGSAAPAVRPDLWMTTSDLAASAQAKMLGQNQIPTSAYLWMLLILVFGVSAAYQLKGRSAPADQPVQRGGKWKTAVARAVTVGCFIVAVVWLVRSNQVAQPISEKDQALAKVLDVLRNDQDTRNDTLGGMHIERGPRDAKVDWTKSREEDNRIEDAEVEAACQLATAIADGDFVKTRAIITSYRGKPYARAQVTAALNHAVYKCASDVNTMALNKWVEIETEGLVDGQFALWVSAAEEDEVLVQFMVRDFKYPRQFQSSPTKIASPEEVMRQLQHNFLNSLLSKHPRKVDGTN